jgi:hypothetical protein
MNEIQICSTEIDYHKNTNIQKKKSHDDHPYKIKDLNVKSNLTTVLYHLSQNIKKVHFDSLVKKFPSLVNQYFFQKLQHDEELEIKEPPFIGAQTRTGIHS